jgi:hypothetical protein
MKYIHRFLFLSLLLLIYAPLALAQNGAMITRGELLFGGIESNDEDVILMYASDSNGFCEAELGDLLWVTYMEVLRPDGTIKYHDKGKFFARVYYPATWDDVGDDPCVLWNDDSLLIAEGITGMSPYNDNHLNAYGVPHKRRNVFGFNLAGTLYDMTGLCSSGMMELNTIRRFKLDKDFPDCLPDDCDDDVQVWKGPRVSCY